MEKIFVGCALSDVNRADLPNGLRAPERLADYVQRFEKAVGADSFSFELQPEDAWVLPCEFPDQFIERKTNRWWRAFRQNTQLLALFQNAAAPIGVQQPVQGRDALSSNFFLKYGGIAETQQAMAFAEFIGAEYFVFHLATEDHWGWDRRDQMDKAFKLFKAYAAYYHASGFTFVPCIEILEYPKFPATGGEARELLSRAREIWPATELAFNISHLWGSMRRMEAARLLDTENGRPISFMEVLEYALDQTWSDVHVFQLGGCWESETHAVPGLHPQQDPFRYPMKLRESPGIYAEMGELDLNQTLESLVNHTVRKGRALDLILTIHDRDIAQVLEAVRLVRADLIERAQAQPSRQKPAPRKRAVAKKKAVDTKKKRTAVGKARKKGK